MRMLNLAQRSDAWQQWRRQGITATESGVIMGLNPYKTPWRLWCEKTGREEPEDLSGNPLVRFGIEHEDEVRELFELEHCEPVFQACGEFDDDPVFRASFDGLTSAMEPVEIKCPSETTMLDVRMNGLSSKACQLYGIQVQHQMMVAGSQRGWLIFFDRNSRELVEFCIDRNEAVIEQIRSQGKAFWQRYLVTRKEPPKDPMRDIFTPISDDDIFHWIECAADFAAAQKRLAALQVELDEIEAVKQRCKAEFIAMMGSYRAADFAGVAVTKRMGSGAVDYKKFLADKSISETELDPYRSTPTASWSIRLSEKTKKRESPKQTLVMPVTSVTDTTASLWF